MLELKLPSSNIPKCTEFNFVRPIFWKKIQNGLPEMIKNIKNYCKTNSLGIIAANEAGIYERIIFIDKKFLEEHGIAKAKELVLINPVVTKSEGRTHSREKLVCNGKTNFLTITRPYKITVGYYMTNGTKSSIELTGIAATHFCQKYQLLDGIIPSNLEEDITEQKCDTEDYKVEDETGWNMQSLIFTVDDLPPSGKASLISSQIKELPGVYEYLQSSVDGTIHVIISADILSSSMPLIEQTNLFTKIENIITSHGFIIKDKKYELVGTKAARCAEVLSKGIAPRNSIVTLGKPRTRGRGIGIEPISSRVSVYRNPCK